MKITSLAYSRSEDDPKHRKNPDAVRPAPSPLGLAALGVGGGGSSDSSSSGITIGTTTITSGTTGRVLYNSAAVVDEANVFISANTVEQRNSTNAQTMRWYGTHTDASNYARAFIDAAVSTAGTVTIGSQGLGTGASTLGALNFTVNGTSRLNYNFSTASAWNMNANLVFSTDNTYDIGASGANRPRNVFIAGNITGNRADFNGFYAVNNYFLTNSGNLTLWNLAATDFSRLQFGGTSASFPSIKRNGTGLDVRLADDSGYSNITVSTVNIGGSTVGITSNSGGYGPGSTVVSNGSNSHSFTQYRLALLSTSSTLEWSTGAQTAGDLGLARPAAKLLSLTDGSTGGAALRAVPDSPTQITADQNDYQAGTGRSLFYRLSSDASRSITGFNPAGSTNQNGELHYFINVGSNNIVLVNESASSTAANRFTTVTGADITLAANEMAMLVYDNTSARWRVAKM